MTQVSHSAAESNACFRVRATFAPLTHIELISLDLPRLEQELADKIRQAPMFFRESPVVLSLERFLEPDSEIDFRQLLDLFQRQGIKPIAIRGGRLEHQTAARGAGLLLLPANKQAQAADETAAPVEAELKPAATVVAEAAHVAAEAAPAEAAPVPVNGRPTKLINYPIRSGQQIYAAGADLIVLAPVSAGAELLADGHIHVYAPLRGRALAGVMGDTSARIFCRSLEAELVSVAGQYKISEDLQNDRDWRKSVQVFLRDDRLVVEPI